jgi:hypothetical protein
MLKGQQKQRKNLNMFCLITFFAKIGAVTLFRASQYQEQYKIKIIAQELLNTTGRNLGPFLHNRGYKMLDVQQPFFNSIGD